METELYQATKQFVIVCFELLNKDFEGNIAGLEKETIIHENKFIEAPPRLTCDKWSEIERLPEYQKCKSLIEKDNSINIHLNKLVGDYEGRQRIDVNIILRNILLDILYQQNTFEFKETIFLYHFNRMKEFFSKSKLKFCSFAPLYGFSSTTEEIQFDKNIRIIKLSDEKINKLHNNLFFDIIFPTFTECPSHIIERIYETDKIIGEKTINQKQSPTHETKNIFNELITTLRLFKKGSVGYDHIIIEPLDRNYFLGFIDHKIYVYPCIGKYILTKEEIEKIKGFFIQIKNRSEFLNIALDRFTFAQEREKPPDKLIDYIIALESLFVNTNQELSYRLSIRASFFLGNNKNEKKKYLQLLKKLII